MPVNDVEVYVTRDGHGRVAIVRRDDGFFCIYRHVRLSGSWMEDGDPALLCYDDPHPEQVAQPLVGMFGAVDDARRELLSMPGFSDARGSEGALSLAGRSARRPVPVPRAQRSPAVRPRSERSRRCHPPAST